MEWRFLWTREERWWRRDRGACYRNRTALIEIYVKTFDGMATKLWMEYFSVCVFGSKIILKSVASAPKNKISLWVRDFIRMRATIFHRPRRKQADPRHKWMLRDLKSTIFIRAEMDESFQHSVVLTIHCTLLCISSGRRRRRLMMRMKSFLCVNILLYDKFCGAISIRMHLCRRRMSFNKVRICMKHDNARRWSWTNLIMSCDPKTRRLELEKKVQHSEQNVGADVTNFTMAEREISFLITSSFFQQLRNWLVVECVRVCGSTSLSSLSFVS